MLSLMHHLCSEKFNTLDTVHSLGGRREWGTHLYKPYRFVAPQRLSFLHRFGLKTGRAFGHFGPAWLSRELRRCMYVFSFQFQTNKTERVICKFRKILRHLFVGVII